MVLVLKLQIFHSRTDKCGYRSCYLTFCPRRGLPRSSAPGRVGQGLSVCLSVCLFVCLPGFSARFAIWHMHRLQTQMPFVFFRGGSEEGPIKTSFKQGWNCFLGHVFFDTFSQNDQTKCARPEALMDIRNTLAQDHYGTRLGSPLRGQTAPAVSVSAAGIFLHKVLTRKSIKMHSFSWKSMHFQRFSERNWSFRSRKKIWGFSSKYKTYFNII